VVKPAAAIAAGAARDRYGNRNRMPYAVR